MTHAVIMAGGSGTRFWPASRAAKPKQFLELFGQGTMIQQTVQRLSGLVAPSCIWIVTNEAFRDLVAQQLPEIPAENILCEPVARNTAPCIAISAACIKERDPGAVMVVLPADHVIEDEEIFREVLSTGIHYASGTDSLITIGIAPNRPETGYGYIQAGELKSPGRFPVHAVKRFAEKPALDKAIAFLASGDYFWNSGMFIWSVSSITKSFSTYRPDIASLANSCMKRGIPDLQSFFNQVASVSIDYGIMEAAENVVVIPGNFGWNDVGSWTAVHELAIKDENGNALLASPVLVQSTKNSLVSSSSGKMIAVVGLDGVAVVETDDAILVTSLSEAQRVKEITAALKEDLSRFR